MASSLTFRDLIKTVSPRWLQKAYGTGHKLLYALALHVDLLGDAVVFGVRRKFPGYDSTDALDLTGRDRKIRRGRSEPDEAYTARCLRWLDDHPLRGNPYAMLEQLHSFYAAAPFRMILVTRAGVSYTCETDGSIRRGFVAGFSPDSRPDLWARWWLYFEWPDPITSTDTWGSGGDWGDGGVWGSDFTPSEVQDLRLVPTEWNAAHCTGTLVSSGERWGMPPDGTWGDAGTWGGNDVTIGISGGGGIPGLF